MIATPMIQPVGAPPPGRSAVRGGSITVSACGQASVVVDDSPSIQLRPTPCGCFYTVSCRSPALGAMVNGGLTPTLTLVKLLATRLSPQAGKSLVIPPQGGGDSFVESDVVVQSSKPVPLVQVRNLATHAITPSPLRGEGWGGGDRPPVAGMSWGLPATCPLAGLLEWLVVPSGGERPLSSPPSEVHQNAAPSHPHLNHSTKAWTPPLMGK